MGHKIHCYDAEFVVAIDIDLNDEDEMVQIDDVVDENGGMMIVVVNGVVWRIAVIVVGIPFEID